MRPGQTKQGLLSKKLRLSDSAPFLGLKVLGNVSFPKTTSELMRSCLLGTRSGHIVSLQRRLLTRHSPIDNAELVAIQDGLAAMLLQLVVAAVVSPAAPGGWGEEGGGLCR